MEFMLRNQLIRTCMALCRLAARSDADDVRDDVAGHCTDGLELWSVAAPGTRTEGLRSWCAGVAAFLERLEGRHAAGTHELARAKVMLLRLQAQLPAQSAPTDARERNVLRDERRNQPKNRLQVLEAVAASSDMRTKDIVERFRGTIAPRTVKRALADLTAAGLVMRVEHDDRTVSYRATGTRNA